ncbi:MAG: ribose-5-phosphate isomerase RpiA [Burkholderia sp.]
MTQDDLKRLVGQAAADYVLKNVPKGSVIGVGTGSTAHYFIDALDAIKMHYRGAVSSSIATTQRLELYGIRVFNLHEIDGLRVYVDGADELDASGAMIKGGGGALTREKIIASVSGSFVCIADSSKRVATLGAFPLPVEVVPIARTVISRRLTALGGIPVLRMTKDGVPFLTDNGNEILDVQGLAISEPRALETTINGWPGVVTVGLFAERGADLCLLGGENGVETINYRAR